MDKVFEKIIDQLKAESIIVDDDAGNRAVEIIEQAAAEYNNGWIPCSERLPEESLNSVLGFDAYRKRCCLVQYCGGRWILDNDIDSVKIIAWQQLPEPYRPKGEQDE